MIMQLVEMTGVWGWWILALVLFGIEILAPGTFFLWLGFAASAVGAITLVLGLDNPIWPWQLQWLVFGILSVAFVLLGRRYYKPENAPASDHPDINKRGEQLIGRTGIISEVIKGGTGRMKIGETTWRVVGPDMPEGASAKVVSADGVTLEVEPTE